MARSFFTRTPTEGKPIALRGVAEGLRDIDQSMWNMTVLGGYIDRTIKNNWVIVPDLANIGGGPYIEFDGKSIEGADTVSQYTQVYNWDTASAFAPDSASLFLYKGADSYGAYATPQQIVEEGISTISPPTYIPVDDDSIQFNASGKLEWKGWAGAAGNDTATIAETALIGIKLTDTAGYIDDIDYVAVSRLVPALGGPFWVSGDGIGTCYGSAIGSDSATNVISLTGRTLEGGLWTASNGIDALKGTAAQAGRFENGTQTATFCNGSYAGQFFGDVDVSSPGVYMHEGVQGWSGTFQATQSGVTKDVTVSGGIITGVA